MKAIVFFKDGHTENVLCHNYIKNTEGKAEYLSMNFKFQTESGLYLYTEYLSIIPALPDPNDNLPPLRYKDYKFYKYNVDIHLYEEEWTIIDEITKIEFYDNEEESL